MPIERLTDRRVKTVRAEGKPLEVRDALVRGLELRVMLSGSKSWALRNRRKTDGRKRKLQNSASLVARGPDALFHTFIGAPAAAVE
jgi:hypothetical protein